MTREPPAPTDTIAQLEEIKDWSLTDWEYAVGEADSATLTVELQHTPEPKLVETEGDTHPEAMKELVAQFEEENEEGAYVDAVIDAAQGELDLTAGEAAGEIENLKRKGELYEPRSDYLRTT